MPWSEKREPPVIETATAEDFGAIANLNVSAYAEFASRLQVGSWEVMQKNLRNVAERAKIAQFLIWRSGNAVVGSVGYCPAGKGDPAIFAPDMASILLLAVDPAERGRGIARDLTLACIARARGDKANSIGLYTSELMQSAQHLYRGLGFQQDLELPMRYGVRYFRFVLSLADCSLARG
jgi:ribosomal protein S18 acetylase RimI-like enzyme